MQLETKNLFVDFAGKTYQFNVTPIQDRKKGKTIFEIDLNDQNPKTIHYSYENGWWQLTGNPVYTDLLHFIGARIQRNYPDLF